MTIRFKIILITILGLLFTIGGLGEFSARQAENILMSKSYDSLVSQRDSKAQQIRSFFDDRVSDLKVLTGGLDVKELTKELIDIHEHSETEINESFHVTELEVKKKSAKYDKFFQNYIKEYKHYNALLMDSDDGHILYSAIKDIEYGQSVSGGELKNVSLNEMWIKVMELERPVFVDMRAYNDSENSLAVFLGAPVYVDGVFKSIMIFHISIDEINNIMRFREGHGTTQEEYLVGQDKLMRSDSHLDIKNYSANLSFSNRATINTEASRSAILGESGVKVIKDYRGVEVLSAYAPIKIGEDFTWAIISEIDAEEVFKPIYSVKKKILIISLILLILISSIIYMIINKSIILPLSDFQNGLIEFFKYLNKENREVQALDVKSNDEIGEMSRAVNENILKTKLLILRERELYEHEKELSNDLKNVIEMNNKNAWVKDGISQLHEKLLGDLSVSDVSTISITHLCSYLSAGVGVIYILDEDEEILEISGSYAYVMNEESIKSFRLGEGIVGQVAEQGLPIVLKGQEQNQLKITTGISSEKPLNIYTFPLLFKGMLCGVVELGSNEPIDEASKEFLESSNIVIATALATANQNQKVKNLLEDVKLSNVRLQEQQQKLEESNSLLEEQQQQLEESNAQMEEHRQQLEEQNDSLIKATNMLDLKARDLALSNKYKSEFLANMSHELRTPLNSIILLSDMLQDNKNNHMDKDEVKKARVINNSGNELLRLIGDVLDLSKIEAGKMDLIIDKFDSTALCEDFQLQFEDMAQQKLLEFKTVDNYRGEISNDKARLSQVLRNLISNALKFTKEGSITLKIENSDDMVKISVSDTGIGIAQDKIESIFEAFKQADGTTSREYGGTGLGLSISLELVKMMNGEISLESTQDKGSVFTIRIPNIYEPLQDGLKENTSSLIVEDVDDDRDILKAEDRPFLIIEDDKAFANILKDKVNLQDEYALVAPNGNNGLALAREYDVKGVLLDLGLPDMDGIDLLKEFKTDIRLREIPIYVISGDRRVELTKEYGANSFAKKPITDDEITGIIHEIKSISDEIDIFMNRVNENGIKKSKETIDLNGRKILVVDDDIRNVYVLIEALSSCGAEIISANNGQEAIDILSKNYDTDIILMDIMMPIMDGYEATRAIKKDDNTKHIPIIAVTAKAMSDDRDKALEAGCDDYMTKPLQMNILSTIIDAWIKK